ncbi:response regulator transcription factor [Chloroflexi bacterium TSY]|nr:response regulator transcription factor [Chloroflexi bacterium TSY]
MKNLYPTFAATVFFEALRAGASGYLLKEAPGEELVKAIHSVYRGGVYVSASISGSHARNYLKHKSPPRYNRLTAREREILLLIAQGFTNREIANHLTVSLNTIKTHRLHIYDKLDRHDRAGLVNYALEHSLLSP